MNGITLWMAFVDAIPVFIFLAAAITLMKDWREYNDSAGITDYGFITAGALMLFGGAILKVAWKTLYALNVCDYYTLSESFFPMQTIGFVLMSMGVAGKVSKKPTVFRGVFGTIMLAIFSGLVCLFTDSAKADWVPSGTEVLPYESHMPFLLGTFIGFMTLQILLMIVACKRKSKKYIIAFVLSAFFMIAEAVVGSIFDGSSNMHWAAQFIHIFAEIGLLIGARGIYKAKSNN